MSSITDTTSTAAAGTSTSSSSSTAGTNILGKDDFLKIFLAQLSQQDPTAPVDSTQFVAQLAQFSSLELQQNANTDLEGLMMGQAAQQQIADTNLVGKDVLYKTSTISLTSGQPTAVSATVASDAASLTAVITDASGNTVRTLQLGPQLAGPVAIGWDGRDDSGNTLPTGQYSIALTAADASGASIATSQSLAGHVTGVQFNNGSPELLLGSQTVKLSDIVQITERTTP